MFETTKDKRCITHTYIHTQRHHQYTSFGEFRRCETSGSDQKWEKLSQPKTYQSLFGPKLLIAHHFFTTQIFQSKNPTRNWYIFFKKNKNPIQKTTKYSETHLQKPHLWVCMELLRAWVLSFCCCCCCFGVKTQRTAMKCEWKRVKERFYLRCQSE